MLLRRHVFKVMPRCKLFRAIYRQRRRISCLPQIFSICNACNGKDIYLSSCSMCLCMLAIIKSDLSLWCGLCLGRLWSSVLFQKEHTYIWPIQTKTYQMTKKNNVCCVGLFSRFTFTYNVVGKKKSRHETPTTATTTSLQKNHKRL